MASSLSTDHHPDTSPTDTRCRRGVMVFASGELYSRLERGGMRRPYDQALTRRQDIDISVPCVMATAKRDASAREIGTTSAPGHYQSRREIIYQ
jgi:hypothetical protein